MISGIVALTFICSLATCILRGQGLIEDLPTSRPAWEQPKPPEPDTIP